MKNRLLFLLALFGLTLGYFGLRMKQRVNIIMEDVPQTNEEVQQIVNDTSTYFWDTVTYFKPYEFDSPDMPNSGNMMDEEFIMMLDECRRLYGSPFIINSGYRTPSHNSSLDGHSPTSSHMKGNAADIHCTSFNDMIIKANIALSVGIKRVGVYYSKKGNYFIHLDNDPVKDNAIWKNDRITQQDQIDIINQLKSQIA